MQILRSPSEVSACVSEWRHLGKSVAFTPTMGALHAGHLSLVAEAKATHQAAIASIFVNPKQFSPGEDLDRYPRDVPGDLEKLKAAGTDAVFLPDVETMYPDGFQTEVTNLELAKSLCGASRKNFFSGICTVVAKLLNIVRPDTLILGEKDFQQLQVVRRMVVDLCIATKVQGAATFREDSGLAMSSRNLLLTPAQRELANAIYRMLTWTRSKYEKGEWEIALWEQDARRHLTDLGFRVDYCELRQVHDLEPARERAVPCRMFIAAFLGDVRLIDNLALDAHAPL